MEAYEHGIVIVCGDGIRRRIYPRIFFYSADYPEKYFFFTFLSFNADLIFKLESSLLQFETRDNVPVHVAK